MIIVFGSINLDLVARVPRLPRPGETLAFAVAAGTLACGHIGAQTALVEGAIIATFAEQVESSHHIR